MSAFVSFEVDLRDDHDTALLYAVAETNRQIAELYGRTPPCGEHDGTGYPCPTCDICDRSMCSTEDMEWNGETGNHIECEAK